MLEGGSWQAARTLDFLEAAGVKAVSAKGRPNQKLVEGWFNRLWTVMSAKLPPRGQVGRFRGEMAKENRLWAAVREGRRDPRGIFPDLREFLAALDESVAYLNADKVCSREYGTWVPAERWEAQAEKGRPVPEWLRKRALPVNEVRALRRGGIVSVAAECPFGWRHEYVFAVPDAWRFADGTEMRVMFDPWRVREGAWVETADGREAVAEAAPCVSPAPDPESPRCWLDPRAAAREARRASRAAVATQTAAYDGRGAMARRAESSDSPRRGLGVGGGVPPTPEPEDAAAWMEREREREAEMAALLADEERLVYA